MKMSVFDPDADSDKSREILMTNKSTGKYKRVHEVRTRYRDEGCGRGKSKQTSKQVVKLDPAPPKSFNETRSWNWYVQKRDSETIVDICSCHRYEVSYTIARNHKG